MQNLLWARGTIKRLKFNDNPFWRDQAAAGQGLALAEQSIDIVEAERKLWRQILKESCPLLTEINNQKS